LLARATSLKTEAVFQDGVAPGGAVPLTRMLMMTNVVQARSPWA
jgi:hypothetical protein